MNTKETRGEWEHQPTNPDLAADLGYNIREWEVIHTEQSCKSYYIFLPNDQEMLKNDAFIVAEPDAVCDLDGML